MLERNGLATQLDKESSSILMVNSNILGAQNKIMSYLCRDMSMKHIFVNVSHHILSDWSFDCITLSEKWCQIKCPKAYVYYAFAHIDNTQIYKVYEVRSSISYNSYTYAL
jgi:hypothetical protein